MKERGAVTSGKNAQSNDGVKRKKPMKHWRFRVFQGPFDW